MKVFNKETSPEKLSSSGKLIFLAKDTLFYGLLKLITLLFPFIIVPLYTSYFSVREYGLLDSFLSFATLVTTIIVLGQDSAVARWFFKYEKEADRKRVIFNSLIILIFTGLLVLSIIYFFSKNISKVYLSDANFNQYIIIVSTQSIFLVLNNFSINILKWTFSRLKYAILSLLYPLLLLISVLFVVHYGLSIKQLLIILVIVSAFISLIGIIFIKKYLFISLDKKLIKDLISYGAPLGIIAISSTIVPTINRGFIANLLNIQDLGIYSIAFKISSLVVALNGMFHMAWGPFSYSIYKEKDAEKIYNIVLKVYFFVFTLFLLIILISSKQLVLVLSNAKYLSAISLIFPISLSFIIRGIAGMTGIGIGLSLKSYYYIIPYFASLLTLFVLNFFLIPKWGMQGMVNSVLVSSFVQFIIVTALAKKLYNKITFNVFRLSLVIILLIVLSIMFNSYFENFKFILILGIMFLPVFYFFFLTSYERKKLINLFRFYFAKFR